MRRDVKPCRLAADDPLSSPMRHVTICLGAAGQATSNHGVCGPRRHGNQTAAARRDRASMTAAVAGAMRVPICTRRPFLAVVRVRRRRWPRRVRELRISPQREGGTQGGGARLRACGKDGFMCACFRTCLWHQSLARVGAPNAHAAVRVERWLPYMLETVVGGRRT